MPTLFQASPLPAAARAVPQRPRRLAGGAPAAAARAASWAPWLSALLSAYCSCCSPVTSWLLRPAPRRSFANLATLETPLRPGPNRRPTDARPECLARFYAAAQNKLKSELAALEADLKLQGGMFTDRAAKPPPPLRTPPGPRRRLSAAAQSRLPAQAPRGVPSIGRRGHAAVHWSAIQAAKASPHRHYLGDSPDWASTTTCM